MALEIVFNEKSQQPANVEVTDHVNFADLGSFDQIKNYIMECPDAKVTMPSKLFLKDLLNFSAIEMSLGYMEPNMQGAFAHKHVKNEEVYLVLKGNGVMTVDGKAFKLKEGSCIRVSPAGVRKLDSGELGLTYLCIQAKAGSLEGYTMTDGQFV